MTETQIVRITYRIVAEMGEYQKYCQVWSNKATITCTSFQEQFIYAQADLRDIQQTARQGEYRAQNSIRIQGEFANMD